MSKTVYLLDTKRDFIAFGAGMFLVNNQDNTIKVGLLVGPSVLGGFDLSSHPTEKDAAGAHAAWIQAIIAASEGTLLRWDVERGCVVDELAPDEGVFADEHLAPIDGVFGGLLPVPEALVEDVAQMVKASRNHHFGCPACGKCLVADAETGELICPVCPTPEVAA